MKVVETVPAGWSATEMSHGGSFAAGKVTWSLSDILADTVLTYTLIPDDATRSDATVCGTFAPDGGASIRIVPSRIWWVPPPLPRGAAETVIEQAFLGFSGATGSLCANLEVDDVRVSAYPADVVGRGFIRADSDADGAFNITDGVFVLNFLFLGGAVPPCLDAADSDDDGDVTISDGIYTLNFLFRGGPAPPAPYPTCGSDPAGDGDDGVTCGAFPPCP